ncbi:MAG: CopG family transcriptional regulator [Bryobacterales bacterium]|nr:CopG family transcriptional regulator [Bryobacterales bacterium]
MRTTLTLDPDVAAKVKERVRETNSSLKDVVNRALRAGLAGGPLAPPEPFRVTPHNLGLLPGIDPYKLNQLVDDLEIDEFLNGHSGR